ncbi:MAG: SIS domain-containing protein [Candidatus Doudnabacteria bacterium]|nr:SIS domain-containing protein [Candidatus Doudnabacteria bacterium]
MRQWSPDKEFNQETVGIDTWDEEKIGKYRIKESQQIHKALVQATEQLITAARVIIDKVRQGGRVITIGAGGSGVAGMSVMRELPQNHQDAKVEQFFYCVAGGSAIFEKFGREELEDSPEEGRKDVEAMHLSKNDVLICISATGRTPYTRTAAAVARQRGAFTIAMVCQKNVELGGEVDHEIVLDIGPETLVGATCGKAASVQKEALDVIFDIVMVKLGYTNGNVTRPRLVHDKARIREAYFRQKG